MQSGAEIIKGKQCVCVMETEPSEWSWALEEASPL